MVDKYKKDLQSSDARLDQWKNGEVTASERRIVMTKLLAEAWEDYTSNHQDEIMKAFKHCGIYNALDGSENHLVRLRKMKGYEPPKKEDKPE